MWDLTTIQLNNICATQGMPNPTTSAAHENAIDFIRLKLSDPYLSEVINVSVCVELMAHNFCFLFDAFHGSGKPIWSHTFYRDRKPKQKKDKMQIRAAIIHPSGVCQLVDLENDLGPLQSAVGGHIESVAATKHGICFVDEDGRNKNLKRNTTATEIVAMCFGRRVVPDIVGRMVITGFRDGECVDVPYNLLSAIGMVNCVTGWVFGEPHDLWTCEPV